MVRSVGPTSHSASPPPARSLQRPPASPRHHPAGGTGQIAEHGSADRDDPLAALSAAAALVARDRQARHAIHSGVSGAEPRGSPHAPDVLAAASVLATLADAHARRLDEPRPTAPRSPSPASRSPVHQQDQPEAPSRLSTPSGESKAAAEALRHLAGQRDTPQGGGPSLRGTPDAMQGIDTEEPSLAESPARGAETRQEPRTVRALLDAMPDEVAAEVRNFVNFGTFGAANTKFEGNVYRKAVSYMARTLAKAQAAGQLTNKDALMTLAHGRDWEKYARQGEERRYVRYLMKHLAPDADVQVAPERKNDAAKRISQIETTLPDEFRQSISAYLSTLKNSNARATIRRKETLLFGWINAMREKNDGLTLQSLPGVANAGGWKRRWNTKDVRIIRGYSEWLSNNPGVGSGQSGAGPSAAGAG